MRWIDPIKKIYHCRGALWDMALKNFKAKYSGSVLGIWWAVVNPFILALSINFVFVNVFCVDVDNFTMLVFAGIIPWLFFANTLFDVSNSFIDHSQVLHQTILPREIIPISCIVSNMLTFFANFFILLLFSLLLKWQIIWLSPFLLIALLIFFLFIIGLGLFLSVLNVFFKDLTHFLSVGIMIWFWATPVFYSLDMVRMPYRWICLANPVTYFVVLFKSILARGVLPPLEIIGGALFFSIIFFVGGANFFIKYEDKLLKKI